MLTEARGSACSRRAQQDGRWLGSTTWQTSPGRAAGRQRPAERPTQERARLWHGDFRPPAASACCLRAKFAHSRCTQLHDAHTGGFGRTRSTLARHTGARGRRSNFSAAGQWQARASRRSAWARNLRHHVGYAPGNFGGVRL